MEQKDFEQLTEIETTIVDDSFDRGSIPNRFRNLAIGSILMAALAIGLYSFQASRLSITATLVFFIAVVFFEKITSLRTQMNSRSAIRKLVHRVEQLEGLPATPDNAEPSKIAQRFPSRASHAA